MLISDSLLKIVTAHVAPRLPEHIMAKTKLCVLDYLGCAYAGYGMNRMRVSELIEATEAKGRGKLLAGDQEVNASMSALINGMSAHATELDDGHRIAAVHPGSAVISALIASCANRSINGMDFLRGMVAGYEVAIRLGEAIQPSHKLRGGHATGTCGTVGAAVAVAVAHDFDPEHMKDAISAACTSASGLLEMIDDDSQLKAYNAGLAAMNGYIAAMMGLSGYAGPEDPIGGNRGFLRFMADEYDKSALTADINGYKIEQIYFKPYAACRHSHPAVEGALELAAAYTFVPSEIIDVEIQTYKLAINGHDKSDVGSVEAAKMSIPFSVATAIVNRSAGIESFTEKMVEKLSIKELADKVRLLENKEMTAASPEKRTAEITISLINGEKLQKRVEYPLGEPENPMSVEMIVDKFFELASFAEFEEGRVRDIVEATLSMDEDFDRWYQII